MPSKLFGSSKQVITSSHLPHSSKFSLISISETNIYNLPSYHSYSALIVFFQEVIFHHLMVSTYCGCWDRFHNLNATVRHVWEQAMLRGQDCKLRDHNLHSYWDFPNKLHFLSQVPRDYQQQKSNLLIHNTMKLSIVQQTFTAYLINYSSYVNRVQSL